MNTFGPLLTHYRTRITTTRIGANGARYTGMSQMHLAGLAGFNHSYVTRLENGTRNPGRDTVTMIADALNLNSADRTKLLCAAGYSPDDPLDLYDVEPVIADALRFLSDETVADEVRADVRASIELLVRQARRIEPLRIVTIGRRETA